MMSNRKSGSCGNGLNHRGLASGWDRELRKLRFIKLVFSASLITLGIVVAMFFWLLLTHDPPRPFLPGPEVWSWEEIILGQHTGGRLLGEHITANYKSGSVLLLVPPARYMQDSEEATLAGVIEGLADHDGRVVLQEVVSDNENGLADGYLWFDHRDFDLATEPFADFDVVLSLIGLPLQPERMDFWHRHPRPDLMLINVEIFRLARLIRRGWIVAVAVRSPGYANSESQYPAPDSEELWVIITPANIEELQTRHINLFVPEESDLDS